ncbi:MAG: MauE/DoxX family redox-associated membrane protein [Acidobacteriota bacterium]
MGECRFPGEKWCLRMIPQNIQTIIIFLFRIAIGIVFIYASFDKIAHVSDFGRVVHNYRMLPYYAENILAIMLPWIELFAGIFLILGYRMRGSALVLALLLSVFIVAISLALFRGLDISCGCFNTKEGMKISLELLLRDSLMLIMTVSILLSPSKARQNP